MDCQLRDNLKAHVMQKDGSYEKVDRRGKEPFNSQDNFCKEAILRAKDAAEPTVHSTRIFVPQVQKEQEDEQ